MLNLWCGYPSMMLDHVHDASSRSWEGQSVHSPASTIESHISIIICMLLCTVHLTWTWYAFYYYDTIQIKKSMHMMLVPGQAAPLAPTLPLLPWRDAMITQWQDHRHCAIVVHLVSAAALAHSGAVCLYMGRRDEDNGSYCRFCFSTRDAWHYYLYLYGNDCLWDDSYLHGRVSRHAPHHRAHSHMICCGVPPPPVIVAVVVANACLACDHDCII